MRILFVLTLAAILSLRAVWAQRILPVTPDAAEIVVALGAADEAVGRDMSTKIPELAHLPSVGLYRQLSAESVLAVRPDLVIGTHIAQPQSIFEHLRRLGVRAENVTAEESRAAYLAGIRRIGFLIGKEAEAENLARKWQAQTEAQRMTNKRCLFTYNGTVVAGAGTVADELMRLAGCVNAAGDVDGLKPIGREAWLAADPDLIVIARHQAAVVGGVEGLLKRPEIAATPAGKNRRIYVWDSGDMFHYGLSTPEVLRRLRALLMQ